MFSGSKFRCFSLDEIKDATNNFDERHALGGGGEGKVYLAQIILGSSKTMVAVKDLKPKAFAGFEHEIKTMPKLQHPNILSLLGYCDESGKKILVYEYMANGSLADYIVIKQPKPNSTSTKMSLSWQRRLKICIDAALGLQHFHCETVEFTKGNIHRDIKPENVLLDANWVAKVSDFGLIKSSYAGQIESEMLTGLKGTSGYYAPECVKYRQVTRKADVYAFGVLLFQVLCRKMPWDHGDESYYATGNEDYKLWAQQNIDSEIKGEVSIESLEAFTEIIGRSLKDEPQKRPTMDDVVFYLQKSLKCQEHKNEDMKLAAAKEPIVLDIGGANSDPKHEDPATQLSLHSDSDCLGSPKDDDYHRKKFLDLSFYNKVLKLYTIKVPCNNDAEGPGRVWGSINLNHSVSFDTLAMDAAMKTAIMNDLKMFVCIEEFYKKVGKAWKRYYLLYGPPRTGKSTLVAAMANFLRFDMYELQLSRVHSDSELWKLLLSTTKRSIIVIDDIDYIAEMRGEGTVDATMMLSSVLHIIDGPWADEQIIVFTTNRIEKFPALLSAGRVDMHIHMSYCTYEGFRILVSNYLGVDDHHRLFDKIKDLIEDVQITPPEIIVELMNGTNVDIILDGIVDILEHRKLGRLDDMLQGSGH